VEGQRPEPAGSDVVGWPSGAQSAPGLDLFASVDGHATEPVGGAGAAPSGTCPFEQEAVCDDGLPALLAQRADAAGRAAVAAAPPVATASGECAHAAVGLEGFELSLQGLAPVGKLTAPGPVLAAVAVEPEQAAVIADGLPAIDGQRVKPGGRVAVAGIAVAALPPRESHAAVGLEGLAPLAGQAAVPPGSAVLVVAAVAASAAVTVGPTAAPTQMAASARATNARRIPSRAMFRPLRIGDRVAGA
jgi:hypothetical protein